MIVIVTIIILLITKTEEHRRAQCCSFIYLNWHLLRERKIIHKKWVAGCHIIYSIPIQDHLMIGISLHYSHHLFPPIFTHICEWKKQPLWYDLDPCHWLLCWSPCCNYTSPRCSVSASLNKNVGSFHNTRVWVCLIVCMQLDITSDGRQRWERH